MLALLEMNAQTILQNVRQMKPAMAWQILRSQVQVPAKIHSHISSGQPRSKRERACYGHTHSSCTHSQIHLPS
eukprot:1140716-Pelagomonas_calceolata.AAC.1